MRIKLTEKYRPFSHEAGTSLLLPSSPWKVTVYPTKLLFENLMVPKGSKVMVVIPQIEGPVEGFTIMQDLERKWIRVFGKGITGFFSYRIIASCYEIILFVERCPKEGISFCYEGETKVLKRKEELLIPSFSATFLVTTPEKMHLGITKKQDWTLVKRRLTLAEILPIWFALGKDIPFQSSIQGGTSSLLNKCRILIEEKNRKKVGNAFIHLFQAGFEGILSPRLVDTSYLGTTKNSQVIPEEASPLTLLGEGAYLIRRLFFQMNGQDLFILPCLPVELPVGRFVGIECNDSLTLDIEWSKKLIRRLNLYSKKDQTLTIHFQLSIRSFRLHSGRRGRGIIVQAGSPFELKKDTLYFFDRFQK